MKAWKYLILIAMAAMAVVGCKKEQKGDEPEPEPGPAPVVENLTGVWVNLQDDYRVKEIVEIDKEAQMFFLNMNRPSDGYFYQDEYYGSLEGDEEPLAVRVYCSFASGKVSVAVDERGLPRDGVWKQTPEGFVVKGSVCEASYSLSENTLVLAGKTYKRVTRCVGEKYCTLTTTLEGASITVGAEEQIVHIPYTISPSLPWGKITATVDGASFVRTINYEEGEILVSVAAVQSAASGYVVFHHPGAYDLAVRIVREISRAIVPEWTSKTVNYAYHAYDPYDSSTYEYSIPFTIVNPHQSYNAGVYVEGNPDWISAHITGNRVDLKIEENNSGSSRIALVILTYTSSWGESYPPAPEVPVTITQTYAAPAITLESSSGETDFQEKNVLVRLTVDNYRYNSEVLTSCDADWVSCSADADRLAMSVTRNNSHSSRTAMIEVSFHSQIGAFEDVSATYTLTQRGVEPVITLDPEEMTIDFHERNKWATGEFVSFLYNVDYGTGDLSFTPDVNWITYTDSFWDNDHNSYACAFSVLSNDTVETRTGHITVTAGPTSKVFTLHQTGVQSGIILYEDEQTYNTLGQGGYIKFRFAPGFQVVTPYYDIQCTSNVDWLRPSGVSGQYGQWFSYGFNVDENNSGADREGTLTFYIDGQTSYLKVTQTYTAPEIVFNDPTSTLGYQAGSTWIDCTIRWPRFYQEFTYETDVDWLTIEGGTYGFTVQYAENKTNIIRSATITAHYMEFSKSITVTQGIREYFDLVLTDMDNSSVQYHINWASCNVGAPNGNLCGNYYTWSQAQSNLPSGSRLPTLDEWNDFQHAFTWTETSIGGINGFVGTPIGEANAWIDLYFIPESGRYNNTSTTSLSYNNYAYYWSSTPYQNTTSAYWGAYFYYYNEQYGVIASRGEMTATFRVPIRVVK